MRELHMGLHACMSHGHDACMQFSLCVTLTASLLSIAF